MQRPIQNRAEAFQKSALKARCVLCCVGNRTWPADPDFGRGRAGALVMQGSDRDRGYDNKFASCDRGGGKIVIGRS